MYTTGQMGVATGYAAWLCNQFNTNPRGVYENHIKELKESIDNIKIEQKISSIPLAIGLPNI